MKNLLILIVAIAIFLHFYPQPELESWFEEQKTMVLSEFSNATDTKVRLNPEKIYKDLQPSFGQFNEEEQTFVRTITSTRESVKEFYNKYCENKRPTPKLHQKNQQLICTKISAYQSLF
ncbi:hypothetical protein [Thalassotalea castellviae]|uniref:Uncharacterized protein n=1 Tax=Thalassotalea castellviae TaxID=3075612 RepID=A0ABU3A0X2_9GAMM|nr:hypothetical protein [Thalassotalea sp. W431]MDT0603833.1 hypothetical protein [Thalassotalea sp. W431]